MRPFSIIVAIDKNYGIGLDGQLPWYLPSDLKHFKEITTTVKRPGAINAVIMGRTTWESLPYKVKPLPGRLNIVLSRQASLVLPEGVIKAANLDEALSFVPSSVEGIFIIGGAQVYQHALEHSACQSLFLTHIKESFKCDAFFPPVNPRFMLISASEEMTENGMMFQFCHYMKNG